MLLPLGKQLEKKGLRHGCCRYKGVPESLHLALRGDHKHVTEDALYLPYIIIEGWEARCPGWS